MKTADMVMPRLVVRSDGNLYYMVERDAHSDRGAECSAPTPQPCEHGPVQPVTGASILEAPLCAAIALPADEE